MQTAEGKQKGLKSILLERGRNINGKKREELLEMVRNEPDFLNQKIWLTEIAEREGMEVDFFPKFHCEFNWIERYWGNAKVKTRRSCNYSFEALKTAGPAALDSIDVNMMRRFARKSYRYIDAYREREDGEHFNLSPDIVEWNVKQYSSHRRIDRLLKLEEKLGEATEE